MYSPSLLEVFDRNFDQVQFDENLCKRIIQYSLRYMNRNDDHSAFFGGVLLGVNPIRFLDSDREAWYEDILDIDEDLLTADFRKVKSINHEFKVMSDVFNYTPIYVTHYLVHRIQANTKIPATLRHEACVNAFMVLHFRFLTSLLVKRFRYPADPQVAQATYASLNGRFDIKRFGSWRALLRARSEDLISLNSIYHRSIQNFGPDASLIRVVTDTQGRIREVVKKIYAIHKQFSDAGVRVRTTSDTTIDTDGEQVLKDRTNGYASYLRYINEVVQTDRNFIRDELVEVIASAMQAMPVHYLRESLQYLSNNYGQPHQQYLEGILKETLLYTFNYLQTNRSTIGPNKDLAALLAKLRALFMASRSSDPAVLLLRNDTEKMVKQAINSKNNAVIAAVRTGVLLYIILRAMTKEHYSR